jgi:proteasome lid subunit RPN8/RPN11
MEGSQVSEALTFDNGLNKKWLDAVEQFKTYAMSQAPFEACALILADGSLLPAGNQSPDPAHAFIIDPMAWTKGEAVAVLHSHTAGPELDNKGNPVPPPTCPSALDMNEQIKTQLPWGIVLCNHEYAEDPFWFGDQVPRPPLLGRRFVHGIDDCWSLIRDWHRETHGIILHDEGRDNEWWTQENPPNFYDQFEKAGFQRVIRGRNPVPGDVFICKVHSKVINHAGVFIGDGMILHHLAFQLSQRTPAVRWAPKMDFFVRHKDLPEPEDNENV